MSKFFLILGHGRALESYLIGVKLLFVALLLLPVKVQVLALSDLFWLPDYWLSLPFLTIGLVQIIGMILNVNGLESSWRWRSCGAFGGVCLWSWLILKTIAIGAYGAGALPFWIMSAVASGFLFWRGINKLPYPGTPAVKLQ